MSEDRSSRTLVLIPALDEQETLGEVLAGVRRQAPSYDVLVVDDGSTDGTGAIARAHGATVLVHPFNLGHGAALQTGFRWALERGYAFVVHLDADGQHDPRDLDVLLEPLRAGELDVVVGSRFLAGPGYPISPLRRATIGFFSWLVARLTGLRVTDPTSGFQALTREAFSFHCRGHFPPDFPDADVIVLTHRAGFRIRERPVRMYPHREGRTMHRGLVKVYYVFKQLVSLGMVWLSAPAVRDRPGRSDVVAPAALTERGR